MNFTINLTAVLITLIVCSTFVIICKMGCKKKRNDNE